MIWDEAWFNWFEGMLSLVPDSNASREIENFGCRYVSVAAGQYSPEGARALAKKLLADADEAERNPEVEEFIADLEEADESIPGFHGSWEDYAKALIAKGYRKVVAE